MRIGVIDAETTGLEPSDAIVEIARWDLTNLDNIGWDVSSAPAVDTLVNPLRPIPPQISAIHHIVDADVAGAPSWPAVWPHVLTDCDVLCAHQMKFERQFMPDGLCSDRPWICTYKCAMKLMPDAPAHNNQALRYWLNDPRIDREIAKVAHRAGPDAYVTMFTLDALLKLASVDELIEISHAPVLLTNVGFGKWFGKPWSEVDTGYLHWLLDPVRVKDFDEDVVHTAAHWKALKQARPVI